MGTLDYFDSLAVDTTGYPHIAYYDDLTGCVKHLYWSGSAWITSTIEAITKSNSASTNISLELDPDNVPHIVYFDVYWSSVNESKLKYSSWTGVSWSSQTIVQGKGIVDVSMRLDSHNIPHVAFSDFLLCDLYYSSCTGTSWQTTAIDTAACASPSLAIDSNDNPHIAYLDCTSRQVKYVRWTGSSWVISVVATVTDSRMAGVSLALDADDNPHIAYSGNTSLSLEYAKWNGSSWETHTVDSIGSVSGNWAAVRFPLIAVDSQGHPHISYYAQFLQNCVLKYVYWTGTTWLFRLTEPASTEITLTGTCLVLDSNDNPHITYRDNNNVLRYARCTNSPTLSWTGEPDYVSGGVNPVSGDTSSNLNFRVKYTDTDNDPPATGYPRIVIRKNSNIVKTVPLTFVSGSFDSGAVYSTSTTLSDTGNDFTYTFETYDVWGASATQFLGGSGPEIKGFIKGHVYRNDMSAIPGVSVELSGSGTGTYLTDSAGYFEFTSLSTGNYTVTPHYPGYDFFPSTRTYALSSSFEDEKFVQVTTVSFSDINTYWARTTVASAGDTGYYSRIGIDHADTVYIVFYDDTARALKYARRTGKVWSLGSIDNARGSYSSLSLAIDAHDIPQVAYCFDSHAVKYAKYVNGTWEISAVDSSSVWSGINAASLGTGSDSRPRIAYCKEGVLQYAELKNGQWSISAVDTGIDNYEVDISMALDSYDRPHIAYYNAGNALKYARWNGTGWIKDSIDPWVSWSVSIAVDAYNIPHIAYCSGNSGDLKYAKWTGISWLCTTVDSAGDVGKWASMVIDKKGNPHIAYADYSRYVTKYAGYDGEKWIVQTIDDGWDVDGYTSIALDSKDQVHLSYCDWYNRDLKYAEPREHPLVSWTGEPGYERSIFNVDTGFGSTRFFARVKYSNQYNDPPKAGYPLLHVRKGDQEISGSPFTLKAADPEDTTYDDGKIYAASLQLAPGTDYSCSIEAYDLYGSTAIGELAQPVSGPLVSALALPDAGEVKIVGPAATRGIINPEKGDTAKIYFQGSAPGTYHCRILNTDGELLFEDTKANVNDGFFEWIPRDIAAGIYIVQVEGPGLNERKKLAILR